MIWVDFKGFDRIIKAHNKSQKGIFSTGKFKKSSERYRMTRHSVQGFFKCP